MMLNPFKKAVLIAQCKIHVLINMQALEILRNDNYEKAYHFFYNYISDLNKGVVWADHDFKNIGHFYNPRKQRGLYGHNNALLLAQDYYARAIGFWKENDNNKAMFYLGACAHLIQDMTIPHHANIRLLDDHHRYELYIQQIFRELDEYRAHEGGVYLKSIEELIKYNAKIAIKVYKKFHCVSNKEKKYFRITKYILPLAEKTTAGCFLMFYKESSK